MKQTRKIKPTRRSVSGYYNYNGRSIAYESTLERDFIIYHAFLNDVIDIVPQPITIEFTKHNRTYPYTPDFYVEFNTLTGKKPLIIEVKPRELWQENWRDWSDKWKTMIQYCKEKGYQFHIFDETRIYHVGLENINLLSHYHRISHIPSEVQLIIDKVKQQSLTLGELIKSVTNLGLETQQAKRLVYHLLYTKQLSCELLKPINDLNEISIP